MNGLLNYITDSSRTTLTSITGAVVGTVSTNPISTVASWVAIIAGVLAIINYFFPLRTFYDNRKR